MYRLLLLTSSLLAAAGCSAKSPRIDNVQQLLAEIEAEDRSYEGPDHVVVDLLRTSEGGPRIYVQAELPDGSLGLFMVDTGADVNVLSTETAERLDLDVDPGRYRLAGLSGSTQAAGATLPVLKLGAASLKNMEFAVGVRGVSKRAGFMPLDGILGMEVWSRFIMELDYPADRLTLHRPGTKRLPKSADELHFNGRSIEASVTVETAGEPGLTRTIRLQLDTGASALLMAGESGAPFATVATEGLEPVYGVGASEFLPPSQFLKKTRRIPVRAVTLGGKHHDLRLDAQWLYWQAAEQQHVATLGLIGHRLLSEHRVFIDAQGERLALTRSRRRKHQNDGHQVLLDQDIAKFGEDAPARDLFRARMQVALGEWTPALTLLERYVDHHPEDAEGRVLLARARRVEADLPAAWEALKGLGPAGLVDEREVVAAVNGLALDGKADEAIALAKRATLVRPDKADARLSLADALLAKGDLPGARQALLQAADLMQNPDAFLLRRARVAMAEGDRFAALDLVRRQVQLYPTEGKFLWYYAMLVTTDNEEQTLRRDLEVAVARLHPDLRPLDFMVAAYHAVGDQDVATRFLELGLERDCAPMAGFAPARDNCEAWYRGLAGDRLDHALALVDGALAETGPRSDYLDTKAVVHTARGELDEAYNAAIEAAKLSPDDVYMLWQADRIAAMRDQAAVSQVESGPEE
ncbi:MAG: aspartyl protease family protein [Myxococcota bacterium]